MARPFSLEPQREATITFIATEFRILKLNRPGPSGLLGGYQRMENELIENTNAQTGRCFLTDKKLERLIRYCQSYGPGGPNGRLRKACIPALRRSGLYPS